MHQLLRLRPEPPHHGRNNLLRRVITRHTLDPALGIQADVAHLGRQDRGRQQSLLVWQ